MKTTDTFARTLARTVTYTAVLVTLGLVSACGGGSDADAGSTPRVASLPSTAAGTPSTPPGTPSSGQPAAPAGGTQDDGKRPQFRVDDTDERRNQIWSTYYACLAENGAPTTTDRISTSPVDMDNVSPETLAACADLEPLQPPALSGATNPDFRDDLQAYVQCMKDDGVHVTLYGDPDEINWTYTEGYSVPDDSYEIESRCLVEGFGAA